LDEETPTSTGAFKTKYRQLKAGQGLQILPGLFMPKIRRTHHVYQTFKYKPEHGRKLCTEYVKKQGCPPRLPWLASASKRALWIIGDGHGNLLGVSLPDAAPEFAGQVVPRDTLERMRLTGSAWRACKHSRYRRRGTHRPLCRLFLLTSNAEIYERAQPLLL
jgi:hypothetical protein